MIVGDAVSVVDLNRERETPPFAQSAFIADVLKYTSLEQATFDGRATSGRRKESLEGDLAGACDDLAASDRLRPGAGRKMEPLAAFPIGMPSS